jgi:hypothetical protein
MSYTQDTIDVLRARIRVRGVVLTGVMDRKGREAVRPALPGETPDIYAAYFVTDDGTETWIADSDATQGSN